MMRSSILGASTMLNVLIQHLPLQSLSWTKIWKAFRASDPSNIYIYIYIYIYIVSFTDAQVIFITTANIYRYVYIYIDINVGLVYCSFI